jgi:hypothetical protein
MSRHSEWELRLPGVIETWAANQYDFGTANCLLFARDVIMAVQGGEPLEALGVTLADVHSHRGAARLLAKYGSAEAIITAVLGDPVARLQARRGDLASVATEHGEVSIGVVDGDVVHLICHDFGMTTRPLADAQLTWQVGA